ncbi:MAG: DinB family protein [Flavobacteriia bacterium]|nr:DinB family protein [Flavobacteriia bacterium]
MKELRKRLDHLLHEASHSVELATNNEMGYKSSPIKWSKREILGHLIDSAINNVQRFTEIQFQPKPFKINRYDQDGLVKANDYQHADTKSLVNLWLALNKRIGDVMELQDDLTLAYTIELSDGTIKDLRFLMTDYVDHLEYHVRQLLVE